MISATVPANGSDRVNSFMYERAGFEFLESGRRQGKGTLLITGHPGRLGIGGMVLAADGFPVNVVTMAEPTQELNEWRPQVSPTIRHQNDHSRLR